MNFNCNRFTSDLQSYEYECITHVYILIILIQLFNFDTLIKKKLKSIL